MRITEAMALPQRAEERLKAAQRVYDAHQAECITARSEVERIQALISNGHSRSGKSHFRFDKQTMLWSFDTKKFRWAPYDTEDDE